MANPSRVLRFLGIALAIGLPLPGMAGEVEPGLWEVKFQLDPEQQAQLAEAQKQLQSLPPGQRQMMESMMASRGLNLSQLNAIRTCITPEEARAKAVQLQGDESGDCEQKVLSQTAQVMKMRFNCPDSKGTATVSFDGSKSYRTEIDGVNKKNGKPIQQTMTARWLQADCGGQ